MQRSCLTVIAILVLTTHASAENWPRFRGPGGAGISHEKGLPVKWRAEDYAWKTPLPGRGHSSACIWGDHVFVTSSLDGGRKRLVFGLDAATGKVRWTDEIALKTLEKHSLNSYASATPASDGRRVYVLLVSNEQMLVLAYDFAGRRVWQRDLGTFFNQHGHGCGTSPIVYRDTVIIANQQDGKSFVVALESSSGKVRWKNERQVRLTAHSTPVILRRRGRPSQLFFTNTGDGISSLDPNTGRLIWRANVFPERAVGSPCVAGDLVLGICGKGGRGTLLAAVPIDGRGEVTIEKAAWTSKINLPYVPTPLAFGKFLYLWGDNGVVCCVESATGKEVWTNRIGGIFSTSPVCVDGKLYCISRAGEVVVLATGPEFKLLGRSGLGEGCHGTPAVANGRMIIRGFEHLFCLEAQR